MLNILGKIWMMHPPPPPYNKKCLIKIQYTPQPCCRWIRLNYSDITAVQIDIICSYIDIVCVCLQGGMQGGHNNGGQGGQEAGFGGDQPQQLVKYIHNIHFFNTISVLLMGRPMVHHVNIALYSRK